MNAKLALCIVDEPIRYNGLAIQLKKLGVTLLVCRRLEEVWFYLDNYRERVKLILLDHDLEGDRNGYDVALAIQHHSIPIIITSTNINASRIQKLLNVYSRPCIRIPVTEQGFEEKVVEYYHSN